MTTETMEIVEAVHEVSEDLTPPEALEIVEAVHEVLEDLTPPEALEILTMVSKNLKAEIRDMQ